MSYGTILTLSKEAQEGKKREERKKDNRIVATKESYKVHERKVGERKKRLPDSFGPKTRRRSCLPREKEIFRDAS